MPSQKPSPETVLDEDLPQNNGGTYQEEDDEAELHLQSEDSDRSHSSHDGGRNYEFILVKLSGVRKEFQCPICLGIIRKTRTVMECLHRFCRECIDKSMRIGNKECPSCRTHCASRRSLRDDPNFDALIAVLYPNIDQYEEEELAFHDEEDARNKQIQASIAQSFQQQEALSKKRRRSQITTRRRESYHLDENDDADGNTSSADEHRETRPKRSRRSKGQQSPATAAGGGYCENDSEVNKDIAVTYGGLVGSSEMLAWGRGGMRSHTRNGSAVGGNGKYAHNNRLDRLAEHLQDLDESHQMDIQILLVSLDVEKAPSLKQPYLCCRPTLSVRQICQFIAFQTSSQTDEIELLAAKELHSKINSLMPLDVQPSDSSLLDSYKDKLQPLNTERTLQEVKSTFDIRHGHLILAYQLKSANPGTCNEAIAGRESSIVNASDPLCL